MGPEAPTRERLRLFFALWPPVSVAQALHRLASSLQRHVGGRVMAQDTLHLTLAFLGEVPANRLPELQALGVQFQGTPGFTLALDQLGYWPHNQILWAAPTVSPAALGALAQDLGKALGGGGFKIEARRFRPHLTLLRQAHPKAPLPQLVLPPWPVEALVLVASNLTKSGPRYPVLGRWPLAPVSPVGR